MKSNMIANSHMRKMLQSSLYLTLLSSESIDTLLVTFFYTVFIIFVGTILVTFPDTLSAAFIISSCTNTEVSAIGNTSASNSTYHSHKYMS